MSRQNEQPASYDERQEAARERLRAALAPQSQREHTMADWLMGMLIPPELDVWFVMVERRARTAARAAQMNLAEQVIADWIPSHSAPDDVLARMEHAASGGDSQ